MYQDVIDDAAAPWRQTPPSNPVCWAAHYAGAIMGSLGALDQMEEVWRANLTEPIARILPPLPALRMGSFSIGLPHMHVHPPSIPPGVPLPSFGIALFPGALSVLFQLKPVLRAGDVGITVSCCTFGPPFELALGSSNVFAGGGRVARVLTDVRLHDSPVPLSNDIVQLGMLAAGAATAQLNMASQILQDSPGAAAMTAAQQAAEAAALIVKQMRKIDPGIPFDVGTMLIGSFTVLVGGVPQPQSRATGAFLSLLRGMGRLVGRCLPTRRRGPIAAEHGRVGARSCPS